MTRRGRPVSAEGGAEDILAKLTAATLEAKATTRALHEARRDLKTDWAAVRQWLADEATVQAFRAARTDMKQWVNDELTRLLKTDAEAALTQLNTEVAQLIPLYAEKLEDTFDRIARRIIDRHPGTRQPQAVDVKEIEVPPDLAQELLRFLLTTDGQNEGGVKPA